MIRSGSALSSDEMLDEAFRASHFSEHIREEKIDAEERRGCNRAALTGEDAV